MCLTVKTACPAALLLKMGPGAGFIVATTDFKSFKFIHLNIVLTDFPCRALNGHSTIMRIISNIK